MPKPCSYCGSTEHYSLMCFDKPRKPLQSYSYLRKNGPKADKWHTVRMNWIQQHPGPWKCYICGAALAIEADEEHQVVTLDHVKPRSTHPELQWGEDNLKPACLKCNQEKGGKDFESQKLKREYNAKLEEKAKHGAS